MYVGHDLMEVVEEDERSEGLFREIMRPSVKIGPSFTGVGRGSWDGSANQSLLLAVGGQQLPHEGSGVTGL